MDSHPMGYLVVDGLTQGLGCTGYQPYAQGFEHFKVCYITIVLEDLSCYTIYWRLTYTPVRYNGANNPRMDPCRQRYVLEAEGIMEHWKEWRIIYHRILGVFEKIGRWGTRRKQTWLFPFPILKSPNVKDSQFKWIKRNSTCCLSVPILES